jgi:hypothetical protein
MIEWIATLLLYGIPWWFQVILLAIIVGVPTYLVAAMIWGTEAVNRQVLRLLVPIIGLLVAIGLLSRSRQQGYNDRRAEEEKALDAAEDFVEDKRDEVQKLPDVELDRRSDRWIK